jgi:hypothetical protein
MHRYRFLCTEKTMKQSAKNITLAASTFAVAALFSFSWSEQSGIALSIESAQARVGRPLTPVSVAGVARRQYRRAAIGTAAVVGAGAAYYGGAGYNTGSPYYNDTVRGARAAYVGDYATNAPIATRPHYAVGAYYAGGPWYGYSGWSDYAARNAISCTPGTMVKLDDGLMHLCQ